MRVVLTPPGRGRWSRVIVTYDQRRRSELPLPVQIKPGDTVQVLGQQYRVVRVET